MNLKAALIKFIAKFAMPDRKIGDEQVVKLRALLKDGDCLVSRCEWELSNVFEYMFNRSHWGHAAIYLNGFVYEAVTGGVRRTSLECFCFKKDEIGLCRLAGPDWEKDQLIVMERFLKDQLNESYAFDMDWLRLDQWFCSKLAWYAWDQCRPMDAEAIKSQAILGMKNITPQDIWESVVKVQTFGVKSTKENLS